jgi:hypothetical protein
MFSNDQLSPECTLCGTEKAIADSEAVLSSEPLFSNYHGLKGMT